MSFGQEIGLVLNWEPTSVDTKTQIYIILYFFSTKNPKYKVCDTRKVENVQSSPDAISTIMFCASV